MKIVVFVKDLVTGDEVSGLDSRVGRVENNREVGGLCPFLNMF